MKQHRTTIRGISLLMWCLWIPVSVVTSQAYVNQIGNPRTYQEFKSRVNEYYATHDHGKGTGYTQYVRSTFIDDARYSMDDRALNFGALNQLAYSEVKARSSHDRSTHGDWESLGPYDVYSSDSNSGSNLGRTNCIAYHPSNPDIMGGHTRRRPLENNRWGFDLELYHKLFFIYWSDGCSSGLYKS